MENKNTSNGIGVGSLLTIAFVILKLCHVIEWSWVWVLSPIWIGLGLAILLIGIGFLCAVIKNKKS